MLCSISGNEKNRKLYLDVYKYASAVITSSINNPDAKFDVNQMMLNIYTNVNSKKQDHELAVRMARMVPYAVFNTLAKDPGSVMPLIAKGLDFNQLATLSSLAMDEAGGIEYVENELGIKKDLLNEAKKATKGKTKTPAKKKPVKNTTSSGKPAANSNPVLKDENGDVIIIGLGDDEFTAVAPTVLKDTDQEALSMDKNSPDYNKPNPAKAFFYKVKRAIINAVSNTESSDETDFQGIGPIYLRAQSVSLIPEADRLPNTTDVVLLVVDKNGVPVRFNNDGKVDTEGKLAFYNFRNPYAADGKYEIMRIDALASQTGISREAAKEAIQAQREAVDKIINTITANPTNFSVTMDITGGTLGYLGSSAEPYFISKVAFGNNTFNPQFSTDGNWYFTVPSVSNDPIRIGQTDLSTRPEVVEMLTNLLTEDIQDVYGLPLTYTDKARILKRYVFTSGSKLKIAKEGLTVLDTLYDTSTPEGKAAAKVALNELFSGLQPYRILTEQEVKNRTAKGAKVVNNISEAKRDDILVVNDMNTGEPVYHLLKGITLVISKEGLSADVHVKITPNDEGVMQVEFIKGGYREQYIKDNFMIDKAINSNNELVSLNAYFTFKPLAQNIGELEGQEDSDIEKRARVADIITSQLELGVELPKILETLAEQGYVEKINNSAFFEQTSGRDAIVFNIDGAIVPIYRSSEGTSSKIKGEWYPFFFNGGDWLVKAGADTYKDGYNNSIIKQILDALNKNYKYDKPIAKVKGNNEELLALLPLGGLNIDVSYEENSGIYDYMNYAAIAIILKDWQSKLGNIDVTGYQEYLDRVSSNLIKANPTLKSEIQSAFDDVSKLFAELAALEEDSFEAALRENKEKLTESEKEANSIYNTAEAIKPVKGVTATWVAKVFQQKIKDGMYSKEFANEILQELSKISKLTDSHKKIINQFIDKYTKSTVAPSIDMGQSDTVELKNEGTPPPPPKSTGLQGKLPFDDLMGQRPEDDDVFFKMVAAKTANPAVTLDQINAAKSWYESHPVFGNPKYKKHFSFREMFEMVNSSNPDAIAEWTANGITLFKGSDFTDLYHEAFHGFTQTFMSDAQREALYDEVRKKTGTFTTYEGKIKSFSEATDLEAEEFLAEDFRQYMLSGRKTKAGQPKRNSFFEKLWNILEMLFGNLSIPEVVGSAKANDKILEVYENLRVGNMTDYNFTAPSSRMNSLNKSGVSAVIEGSKFEKLSSKDSKLLVESIDGWISQIIDAANAGLPAEQYEAFSKMQIDFYLNKLSPAEMEKAKLALAPKLSYAQTAKYLKTEKGRGMAYKIVYMNFARLYNSLIDEIEETKDEVKKKDLQAKASLAYWAFENFGNVNNIRENTPDADGNVKGVIGYHMLKSKEFNTRALDLLEVDEIADDDVTSRSMYADRSGNDLSLKDISKSELVYLFKTLLKYDPATGQPMLNELGAPMLMDFKAVWNKVAIILENERDINKMYEKLLKFAQDDEPTELNFAVRQLLNKLGPKGLDVSEYKHLDNIDTENMWTSFWNVFSTRRVPLIAMSASLTLDKATNKVAKEATIGRGINPNAQIGKAWNSYFKWNTDNKYVITNDGVPTLDLESILKDFKNDKYVIDNNLVFEFLNAIGVRLTENEDTRRILKEGDPDLGIRGDYHVIKTLLSPTNYRVKNDKSSKSKLNGYNPLYVRTLSLLESIASSGVEITQPQDLFRQINIEVPGAVARNDQGGFDTIMMSGLAGEVSNWNELLTLEGYFGTGIVSFMVTTASGTTQFEHTLNSSMSILVTDINDAEDYQELISKPHLRQFDISVNPNAKRYAWLRNMFELDEESPEFGKRKYVKGKKVKLELFNISGAKNETESGVSSAAADPFTKFILDLHLITQRGLPELMRHADKSTSYSVTLSNFTTQDGESTGNMYVPNVDFLGSSDEYHGKAFREYLLPNIISEHARVQKMIQKKKDIEKINKKIAKEIQAGKQKTPSPVYDFNYLKAGQEFIAFQGVLSSKTKKQLKNIKGSLDEFLKSNTPEAQQLIDALYNQTKNYFKDQLDQNMLTYKKGGFVADNLIERTVAQYGPRKVAGEVDPSNDQVIEALLNSFTYNSWIHNIESMNMLYGDIALYNHKKEEFHKRNAGFGSTGVGYRTDEDMLNYINSKMSRQFETAATGKSRVYNGTLNTGVMKDKITRSEFIGEIGYYLYTQLKDKALRNAKVSGKTAQQIESEIKKKVFGDVKVDVSSPETLKDVQPAKGSVLHGYTNMNEADAQGWITLDAYRILMFSQGEWSPTHQAMYNAILEGREIPGDKLNTFFAPIKAQYWGQLKTDDMASIAFHKFQLTPIIPTMFATSPKLKALNDKMLNEGVDYALFESGSKISTLTSVQYDASGKAVVDSEGNPMSIPDNVYNNKREITDVPFTVNTIFVEYLKNQLKIEPKFKGKVTIPSQIRKLITADLMENGVPTDFKLGESLSSRIKEWNGLSEAAKIKASTNYSQIRRYEKSVARLTQIKEAQLISRAKLQRTADGKLTGKIEDLINYVKSQLTNQDLADHELDFIDFSIATGKLKHDLSFSLSADKLEKLLNALVTKSLVRQKMTGESLIQVSGAMLEPATEEEIAKYGGTNGLSYYRYNPLTGRIDAMKVKIAMQGDFEKLLYLDGIGVFKPRIENGKQVVSKGKPVVDLDYNASLANLNAKIKDENWLNQGNNRKMITMHGDRIPVQGANSDEVAEIYEFLPKEAGNIIILPAEIVAKSGGDFDIDKLTMMMPNISIGKKKGKYVVDLYTYKSEEELRTLYNLYLKAKAEKEITGEAQSKKDKERALQLYYQMFGGENEAIAEIIDVLLEEDALISFEDFMLKDQEKGAQNEFLDSLNELTLNGENYSNLVRPNATDIFDPIVERMSKLYSEYRPDYSSNDEDYNGTIQGSRLFEYNYNLYKHMTNNYGKKALGIGAIDNTYNELLNRIGMYLVPNNREVTGVESAEFKAASERARNFKKMENLLKEKGKDKFTKEDWAAYNAARSAFTSEDRKLVSDFVQQTLYLPHNTMEVSDSKGKVYNDKAISLSHIMDVNGENKVNDIISQLINGWVDVAKNPWVFYVRGDDKLGPVLLFLVQAGVPVNHAVNMVSQPVVVEYMQTIAKLQSQYALAMDKVVDSLDENEYKITRDRAILKAKEIMLKKLGYEFEGKGRNKVDDIAKTIREESIYQLPKVLKNDMFDNADLEAQLDYTSEKYKLFNNGVPQLDNLNIDYSDETLNDYQKSVFLHYLQIVDMENAVKDIKLRTNVDTGKSDSIYAAQAKILQLQELKRTRLDSNTQGKYWRLPSQVIDRLIPTIKKGDLDTGILDKNAEGTVISSFYIQPLQIEIWKDLFPLRTNKILNSFIADMPFVMRDDAKNNTYLNTEDKLYTEFKSSLIPIIFQNTFLGYDLTSAMKKSKAYYRGTEIELRSILGFDTGAVLETKGGKPVMYFDYTALYNQYINGDFSKDSKAYRKLGLAPMDAATFPTFNEYVKFVFEREYLRHSFIQNKKLLNEFKKTSMWKDLFAETSKEMAKKDGESVADFRKRRERVTFERYIRNEALKNSYNMYALFNGNTAFAFDIVDIKSNPRYSKIMSQFPVLNNLIADSEESKVSGKKRINLAWLDAPTDSETLNAYYEQLQDLANEVEVQNADESLSTEEVKQLTDVFKKLPIVAFLQSGMSTTSRFSLVRAIDQNTILSMTLEPVQQFLKQIQEDSYNEEDKYETLNAYFAAFVKANKTFDARGKNYVVQTNKEGQFVTDLTDVRILTQKGTGIALFDSSFVDNNGVPQKEYSIEGDSVSLRFTRDATSKPFNAVIDSIEEEPGGVTRIILSGAKGASYQLLYNSYGYLSQYITKSGAIIKNPEIETNIVLKPKYQETEETFEAQDIFPVYNGALNPRDNVAQEGLASPLNPKGDKINLKDKFIHHSAYTNKVGLISRLGYGGGRKNEFITDGVNEDGKATVRPEVKAAIDRSIDAIKHKVALGLKPLFSQQGYGQYMIGADDVTGEIVGDPIAKETFKYLSTRLMEEFGYINPNFIKNAEGLKEVVRVTEQPFTDEQFRDMMNKCFNIK